MIPEGSGGTDTTTPPTELQFALLKRLATGEVILFRFDESSLYRLAEASPDRIWTEKVHYSIAHGLEQRGLIESTGVDRQFLIGRVYYRITARGAALLRWQGKEKRW